MGWEGELWPGNETTADDSRPLGGGRGSTATKRTPGGMNAAAVAVAVDAMLGPLSGPPSLRESTGHLVMPSSPVRPCPIKWRTTLNWRQKCGLGQERNNELGMGIHRPIGTGEAGKGN